MKTRLFTFDVFIQKSSLIDFTRFDRFLKIDSLVHFDEPIRRF